MQLIGEFSKLSARIWARPKRVAFLVPESFTNADLNSIVIYCLQQYGGRVNPIVPIDRDRIDNEWLNVLRAADPDILYSFIPLSENLQDELEENLRTGRTVFANEYHKHEDAWHVDFNEVNSIALSLIRLPFKSTLLSRPTVPQLCVEDFKQENGDAYNFCLRNFGLFGNNDYQIFDLETNGLNRQKVSLSDDLEQVFAAVLPTRGKLYPIMFSTAGYSTTEFTSTTFSSDQKHEVIVGDSLHDFLYAWNRGITSAYSWRRRAIWLPASAIKSKVVAAQSAQWLNEHFMSNEEAEYELLSYTSSIDDLNSFHKLLRGHISVKGSVRILKKENACDFHNVSIGACSTNSQRFDFAQEDVAFAVPYPDYLDSSKISTQGWTVEVEFQKGETNLGTNFKRNVWHLPIRNRLDKKFIDPQTPSRITSRGHLAVEVNARRRNFSIRIPNTQQLCRTLLKGPRSVRTNSNDEQIRTGRFRLFETSADGQRLWSFLKLFGSIEKAEMFLDDQGWREVMFAMIGSQNFEEEVKSHISEYMGKSGNPGKAMRKLARFLVDLNSEVNYLELSHILKILESEGSILSANESDFVCERLHSFISKGIFLQGSPSRCYHCGTKRWHRVDELKAIMTCQGCTSDYYLEPLQSLSFRLNDLVVNGIRRSGFLPVMQALFELEHFAKEHLIFIPQQNLFDWSDRDEEVTDLDLVGICDSKFFIGEVKSSERGLIEIDIKLMEEIALDLRPDVFIIAAPSKAFTEKAHRHCKPLIEKLENESIKFHRMPLKWTELVRSDS